MSKRLEMEQMNEVDELAEVLLLDDVELDNDIREWLQTPPVLLKALDEVNREEEYQALQEILSDYLVER